MGLLEVDVDLSRLKTNVDNVKSVVKTGFCAVVKADAYGHGLTEVGRALNEKADEFAVATFDEAQTLSESGVKKPINILGCTDADLIDDFSVNCSTTTNIIPTVCDISEVNLLKNRFSRVNVKLNTGMNRLGVSINELDLLISELTRCGVTVNGIFTHFYKGDDVNEAERQFIAFDAATEKYAALGVKRHCCASCCLGLPPKFHLDMVRCGIAMYGYGSITEPVMSVHTSILQVMDVKKGEHISYGDYVAPRDMKIAAVRVGYADGYRRKNGRERFVGINGKLCPVVGQICMDITLADVTGVPLYGCDRVYLLGGGVSGEMLAESYDTIVYEVLTSFKGRIKRNYFG